VRSPVIEERAAAARDTLPAAGPELVCPRCGTVGPPTARAAGPAAVELGCRRCGAGGVVPLEAARPPARPVYGCPKCGAPRGGRACPRCGLIYARADGSGPIRTDGGTETARLWAAVLEAFDDPERHAAFLAHCTRAGELAHAAACYTEEEASPDRAHARVAEARRHQLRALAETMLTPPARRVPAGTWARRLAQLVAITVLVILSLWAGLYMLGRTLAHRPIQGFAGPQHMVPGARARRAPSDRTFLSGPAAQAPENAAAPVS
jgi:hypothetical protein